MRFRYQWVSCHNRQLRWSCGISLIQIIWRSLVHMGMFLNNMLVKNKYFHYLLKNMLQLKEVKASLLAAEAWQWFNDWLWVNITPILQWQTCSKRILLHDWLRAIESLILCGALLTPPSSPLLTPLSSPLLTKPSYLLLNPPSPFCPSADPLPPLCLLNPHSL